MWSFHCIGRLTRYHNFSTNNFNLFLYLIVHSEKIVVPIAFEGDLALNVMQQKLASQPFVQLEIIGIFEAFNSDYSYICSYLLLMINIMSVLITYMKELTIS